MKLIHPKTLHRAVLTPLTLRQESDGFHTLFPNSFPVPAAPELGISRHDWDKSPGPSYPNLPVAL